MLRLKNGGSIRKGGEKTSTRDYTYKKADGCEMVVPVRTSACSKIEVSNYTKKVNDTVQVETTSSTVGAQKPSVFGIGMVQCAKFTASTIPNRNNSKWQLG